MFTNFLIFDHETVSDDDNDDTALIKFWQKNVFGGLSYNK